MTTEATSAEVVQRDARSGQALEPVYVWDIVVRLTHWLIAFSILILAVTGIYIGNPFLISEGPATDQFVMGTVKIIHFYTAIIFTLSVLTRIGWMFVGSHYARWHQFVPANARRRRNVGEMLRFYLLLRKDPPANVGHNPLAGATYLLVFALYLVMILTGLAMYSVSAGVSYMKFWDFLLPIFGGAQTARWIHHVTMWLLIGFFAHHIWSAILVSSVEKNGTLDSIFSGYKFFSKNRHKSDE